MRDIVRITTLRGKRLADPVFAEIIKRPDPEDDEEVRRNWHSVKPIVGPPMRSPAGADSIYTTSIGLSNDNEPDHWEEASREDPDFLIAQARAALVSPAN